MYRTDVLAFTMTDMKILDVIQNKVGRIARGTNGYAGVGAGYVWRAVVLRTAGI